MKSAPTNYNDDEVFCGSFSVQCGQNKGKCGVCGDNFKDATPRNHELGGTFGQGVIMKTYKKDSVIIVKIVLTANHRGFFIFDLCDPKFGETEECFQKHRLITTEGDDKFTVTEAYMYDIGLKLPKGLECDQCVLRWTYVAGHRGLCDDGGYGCSPQAHFRSCSDIAIKKTLKFQDHFSWTDVCLTHENFIKKISSDHKDRKAKFEGTIDIVQY